MGVFVAKSARDPAWTGRNRPNHVFRAVPIAKAGDDAAELDRILRQTGQVSARVRQAFVDSVARLQGRIDVEALRTLLEQGRVSDALNFLNAQSVAQGYGPLIDAITASTIGVARQTALANLTGGFEASFRQTNPKAIDFLRRYEMNLIRELTDDALSAVRVAIGDGVAAGRNPLDIARDVRQMIGLTEKQAKAVSNYRRLLETGHADALGRKLRDRRFDSTVARSVRGERGLSSEQVDRFVGRYADRYLKYRSETIARTEAKRALGSGNQLLWNQAVDDGQIDADQVTKKWATVGDHKVRHTHVELHGQVVGLNERFTCSGGTIAYPGDWTASAKLTVNCRCAAIYRFKLKEPAAT